MGGAEREVKKGDEEKKVESEKEKTEDKPADVSMQSEGGNETEKDASGKQVVRQSSFVDNELWELANGRNSEIRIKREAFWNWMIKNNPKSLQMIVMFGGAARGGADEP